MELVEHRAQLENLLNLELKDVKPLEDEKVEKIKSLLGLDYTPHILYNHTNIVFFEILEYEKLKSIVKKFEEVLRIEMSGFNLNLYIGNYLNCPQLKIIIN